MSGMDVGKTIGVNTWAAFAGSDDNAVVDGDFAMTEDELQPVLRALRKSGINILGIQNHMTHENPRIMFLHYWEEEPPGIWRTQSRALLVAGVSGVTTSANR